MVGFTIKLKNLESHLFCNRMASLLNHCESCRTENLLAVFGHKNEMCL